MLCLFLLCSRANQLHIHMHPVFPRFPSYFSHHRAVSRGPVLHGRFSAVYYIYRGVCVCVCARAHMCVLMHSFAQLCLTPCDPREWTVACPASLSRSFPRQEYWSGLPFPPPERILNYLFLPFWQASKVSERSEAGWGACVLSRPWSTASQLMASGTHFVQNSARHLFPALPHPRWVSVLGNGSTMHSVAHSGNLSIFSPCPMHSPSPGSSLQPPQFLPGTLFPVFSVETLV